MPLPSAPPQCIDRQRTRTAQDQRHQTGDVQQVDFVTRWTELGPVRGEADCVHGAKAVLDVYCNIAPSIERISGTLTMVTNAPINRARPPKISSKVTSQALARGSGT